MTNIRKQRKCSTIPQEDTEARITATAALRAPHPRMTLATAVQISSALTAFASASEATLSVAYEAN